MLTCAALMGMASFEVLKESFETLFYKDSTLEDVTLQQGFYSSISMAAVVVIKLMLLHLCNSASNKRSYGSSKSLQFADPTLEAVAQDHKNDALSNGVSAIALLLTLYSNNLW